MEEQETGKRKLTSHYSFRDGSCFYYSNVDRLRVVVSCKIIVLTVGFLFHIYSLAHYRAIIIVCLMNLYTCRYGQPLLLLCIKVQSLQEGGKPLLANINHIAIHIRRFKESKRRNLRLNILIDGL